LVFVFLSAFAEVDFIDHFLAFWIDARAFGNYGLGLAAVVASVGPAVVAVA